MINPQPHMRPQADSTLPRHIVDDKDLLSSEIPLVRRVPKSMAYAEPRWVLDPEDDLIRDIDTRQLYMQGSRWFLFLYILLPLQLIFLGELIFCAYVDVYKQSEIQKKRNPSWVQKVGFSWLRKLLPASWSAWSWLNLFLMLFSAHMITCCVMLGFGGDENSSSSSGLDMKQSVLNEEQYLFPSDKSHYLQEGVHDKPAASGSSASDVLNGVSDSTTAFVHGVPRTCPVVAPIILATNEGKNYGSILSAASSSWVQQTSTTTSSGEEDVSTSNSDDYTSSMAALSNQEDKQSTTSSSPLSWLQTGTSASAGAELGSNKVLNYPPSDDPPAIPAPGAWTADGRKLDERQILPSTSSGGGGAGGKITAETRLNSMPVEALDDDPDNPRVVVHELSEDVWDVYKQVDDVGKEYLGIVHDDQSGKRIWQRRASIADPLDAFRNPPKMRVAHLRSAAMVQAFELERQQQRTQIPTGGSSSSSGTGATAEADSVLASTTPRRSALGVPLSADKAGGVLRAADKMRGSMVKGNIPATAGGLTPRASASSSNPPPGASSFISTSSSTSRTFSRDHDATSDVDDEAAAEREAALFKPRQSDNIPLEQFSTSEIFALQLQEYVLAFLALHVLFVIRHLMSAELHRVRDSVIAQVQDTAYAIFVILVLTAMIFGLGLYLTERYDTPDWSVTVSPKASGEDIWGRQTGVGRGKAASFASSFLSEVPLPSVLHTIFLWENDHAVAEDVALKTASGNRHHVLLKKSLNDNFDAKPAGVIFQTIGDSFFASLNLVAYGNWVHDDYSIAGNWVLLVVTCFSVGIGALPVAIVMQAILSASAEEEAAGVNVQEFLDRMSEDIHQQSAEDNFADLVLEKMRAAAEDAQRSSVDTGQQRRKRVTMARVKRIAEAVKRHRTKVEMRVQEVTGTSRASIIGATATAGRSTERSASIS
ncbi:unnamed protein product [Amoebophrya sp. A25]|nr:unnamed protein product [Amoebophrya sp. A25]|eukprot:GSA25T00003529001.1